MSESEKIIDQINIQIRNLLNIRAIFPTIENEMLGQTKFKTAPFYENKGFSIDFNLSEPLTIERIEEINQIGRWVNQSFIVRLCALLESYHVIPQENKGRIDQKLDGHEELDILRRLRNVLAHTSGRYNPSDSEGKQLYIRITEKFSITAESPDTAKEFPLHIHTLLLPLAEGCMHYVKRLQSPS